MNIVCFFNIKLILDRYKIHTMNRLEIILPLYMCYYAVHLLADILKVIYEHKSVGDDWSEVGLVCSWLCFTILVVIWSVRELQKQWVIE